MHLTKTQPKGSSEVKKNMHITSSLMILPVLHKFGVFFLQFNGRFLFTEWYLKFINL